MKLLVITQKVDIDDSNLGFFHHWLEKFAEEVDKLYAACLWEGKHNLPENTEVFSLGKERGYPKIIQLIRLQFFLFQHLRDVDGVFVHMCPVYAITSFPLVKIFNRKMILWYAHGSVQWKLRLAGKMVDKILTASEESCRLKNRAKIKIVGHGIDTELFHPGNQEKDYSNIFNIVSVGRISPMKDQATLIKAIDVLVNEDLTRNIRVKIVGAPINEQGKRYLKELEKTVSEKNLREYIEFTGAVVYKEMPDVYRKADLAINLSHTGSIDKVVLEAMASGCAVLTCNESFGDLLGKRYRFGKGNAQELASKIREIRNKGNNDNLRSLVVKNYSLYGLIAKIKANY